jgi:hypothetical protein
MSTKAASALAYGDTLVLPDGEHTVTDVWPSPDPTYGPYAGGRTASGFTTVTVAGLGSGVQGKDNIKLTYPSTFTVTTA